MQANLIVDYKLNKVEAKMFCNPNIITRVDKAM